MIHKWSFSIVLDTENQNVPLYQQVADKIKKMINTGILKNGDAIPSSRELAQELGVSRKTIVSAMEQLTFKGLLVNKDRVGLFVSNRVNTVKALESPENDNEKTSGKHVLLEIDDGLPDTQLLPFKEFTRGYRQFFTRAAQWKMMGYRDPQGYERFRQEVSTILSHGRGLQASEDEICITRGSQMALYLIANTVLKQGDTIAVENPGYQRARTVFSKAGLNVIPVDVDNEGIDTDKLCHLCEDHNLKAVYLTPRHQYPTTVPLSLGRRKKIAELVEKFDIYVIEDDFGCDFNYSGKILTPLSCLLPKKNRIYVGTFSKIFSPSLRVGYIASSTEIIKQATAFRSIVDIQGDNVVERTLVEMIESGALLRHVKKATKVYKDKLTYLSDRIRVTLPSKVSYRKPNGGLAIWLLLKTNKTAEQIRSQLESKEISIPLFTTGSSQVGLRIGYASLSFADIDKVIDKISSLNL